MHWSTVELVLAICGAIFVVVIIWVLVTLTRESKSYKASLAIIASLKKNGYTPLSDLYFDVDPQARSLWVVGSHDKRRFTVSNEGKNGWRAYAVNDNGERLLVDPKTTFELHMMEMRGMRQRQIDETKTVETEHPLALAESDAPASS